MRPGKIAKIVELDVEFYEIVKDAMQAGGFATFSEFFRAALRSQIRIIKKQEKKQEEVKEDW